MVLLDIGMPGMDGYEVARRLRESQQEPRAALVALKIDGGESGTDCARMVEPDTKADREPVADADGVGGKDRSRDELTADV